MRKTVALVLSLMLLLSLVGCGVPTQRYITEEDGKQYLILPASKEKVRIDDEEAEHLDDLSITLLKKAEEKIYDEISQYSEDAVLYLVKDTEDDLWLCAEIIVMLDSSESASEGEHQNGCGTDHEHKFYKERITN